MPASHPNSRAQRKLRGLPALEPETPRQFKARGLHGFMLVSCDENINVLRVMFSDKVTDEQLKALVAAIQDFNRRN